MDVEVTEEAALFRPVKRRKFQRARPSVEHEEPGAEPSAGEMGATASNISGESAEERTIAEILRMRTASKRRGLGVEFSNKKPDAVDGLADIDSLRTTEAQADKLKAISDRFVGHTGQVVDVDKHMMAYIDSEMAKRRLGHELPFVTAAGRQKVTTSDSEDYEDESTADKKFAQRQPASLGKLQEIDLGTDASLRNAERTEAAIRRRKNGDQIAAEEEKPAKPRKPRLGRDGKPMKPRPKKRRDSEDIKRDQLVEQVLRESRLEIYDEPEPPDNNNDLNADERIAEQFRQDFMDAMQARQRHHAAGQPKPPAGKASETSQKGPKLGGSRSARAAMREKELQEKGIKK